MIRILLLSKRPGAAEWHIRNRFGIHSLRDQVAVTRATEAARIAMNAWQRAEPFTEFTVVEEPHA